MIIQLSVFVGFACRLLIPGVAKAVGQHDGASGSCAETEAHFDFMQSSQKVRCKSDNNKTITRGVPPALTENSRTILEGTARTRDENSMPVVNPDFDFGDIPHRETDILQQEIDEREDDDVPMTRAADQRNQTVMPEWNGRCGAIRNNYKCSGQVYEDWLSNHSKELFAMDKAARETAFSGRILFVGNSHMREVAETFTCQRRDHVVKFEAISEKTSCLSARAYSAVCEDYHSGCRTDLAKVTLTMGGRIYFAINHLWLYQKKAGMRKILASFGARLADLSAVVLGQFNELRWYLHKNISDACNETASISSSDQMWSTMAFADYLSAGGFKGKLLLGGAFGENPVTLPQERLSTYPFSAETVYGFRDAVRSMSMPSRVGHQCIPGTPNYISAEVAEYLA